MRPRKIILCIDGVGEELSVLKFTLETVGHYRVLDAKDGFDAIGLFSEYPVDLVISQVSLPGLSGPITVHRMKQIKAHIPMILLGTDDDMGKLHSADALLNQIDLTMTVLLERVRMMSARKRGPRLGSKRMPRAVKPEMDEVAVA